jgi:site-specific DNA-methyltransferase (adenine-specific)
MGSGTTAVAAINTKRNYIGYDINVDYIKLACERIKNAKENLVSLFDSSEEYILENEPNIGV